MNLRKSFLLGVILISGTALGSVLIWHGLSLDKKAQEPEILGNQAQISDATIPIQEAPTAPAQAESHFLVTKVIDGDTFEIEFNGKMAKVRIIGIDTPETVDPRRAVGCFGKKASEETKRLIEGKEVVLTKDISETDKYNRLLRYVYLPIGEGNNLFVNDYLIRQGFAKNLTYPPDIKHNARFLEAEKEARDNLRGLWGECK